MTTVTAPVVPAQEIDRSRPSRAVAVRRGFLIASPVLAGLFAIVAAVADPAAGVSGEAMWKIYIANPEPLQLKSLGYHWSYAFWIAPALLMAAYVKGKGAWIANVGAFLGFAGMTTLPGMLLTDWYDSAIGQLYGLEGTVAVQERMSETMWGVPVMILPGLIGFALALPIATVAMWRAGLVRWWALATVVAGFAAFMVSSATWWGAVLTTVCFTVFAYALALATRGRTEI
jgi:hypothetical protein